MIENIRSLIKDPNPWSWSYKVSVPAQWKELMSNPEMYPPGWESRTFTQWPSRQQQGGPRLQENAGPMGPKLQKGRWLSEGSVLSQQDTPRAG